MNSENQITTIADLLESTKHYTAPVLVYICFSCDNENYLMEEVMTKVQAAYGHHLNYIKLEQPSHLMKQELMVSKNPIILIINNGQIDQVFNGTIGFSSLASSIETSFPALTQKKSA